MSELDKLYSWCHDGTLYDFQSRVDPTIVDLSKAMASICGAEVEKSPDISTLVDFIGTREDSLIMVLVDGLGSIQLDEVIKLTKAGEAGLSSYELSSIQWLASFKKNNLRTIFPSVTAPALTTIATATWPCEHGILSWWMHLDEQELTFEVLPWVERFSRKKLSELSIQPEDVFSTEAVCSGCKRDASFFLSNLYVNSPFSRYCRNGLCDGNELQESGLVRSTGVGYVDYDEAIEKILPLATDNSYIYWYIPEHDSSCHRSGIYSEETIQQLGKIASAIRNLAEKVPEGTRIVVTGDHGHVDLPTKTAYFFVEGDELMDCLEVPPFGEPSVPMFKVKKGFKTIFKERFLKRFGDKAALLSKIEVVDSKILGPLKYSEHTLQRLGDFTAIFPEPAALIYKKKREKLTVPLKGVHGGLTHQEMIVPLIIIENNS